MELDNQEKDDWQIGYQYLRVMYDAIWVHGNTQILASKMVWSQIKLLVRWVFVQIRKRQHVCMR
jgi:hypothetical protein